MFRLSAFESIEPAFRPVFRNVLLLCPMFCHWPPDALGSPPIIARWGGLGIDFLRISASTYIPTRDHRLRFFDIIRIFTICQHPYVGSPLTSHQFREGFVSFNPSVAPHSYRLHNMVFHSVPFRLPSGGTLRTQSISAPHPLYATGD